MKSFLSSPVSTVLLLASLCTAAGYSQNQEKYVEGIAAVVGDNIILKSDLSHQIFKKNISIWYDEYIKNGLDAIISNTSG